MKKLFEALREEFEKTSKGEWTAWGGKGSFLEGDEVRLGPTDWRVTCDDHFKHFVSKKDWTGFPRADQALGSFHAHNDQGWAVLMHNQFEDLMEAFDLIHKAAKRVYDGLEQDIATVPRSGAHEDLKNAFQRAEWLANFRSKPRE